MTKTAGPCAAAVIGVLLFLSAPNALFADDCGRVLGVLKEAERRLGTLRDYTLKIERQERVKGKLSPPETMFVKWRRPFSVYIKTISGKHKDREIIYVRGKNNDKMIVSPGGLLGGLTVKISPDSVLAKKDSRHTITEAGLPAVIARMISTIQDEKKEKGCPIEVSYAGEESRSPEKVICLRIKNSGYAPRTDIELWAESLLPYSIISYDTDGSLLESYTYRDIKTNVGLTDADFDPTNPDYRF